MRPLLVAWLPLFDGGQWLQYCSFRAWKLDAACEFKFIDRNFQHLPFCSRIKREIAEG